MRHLLEILGTFLDQESKTVGLYQYKLSFTEAGPATKEADALHLPVVAHLSSILHAQDNASVDI